MFNECASDTQRQSTICELIFPTSVLAVKMNRKRLIVVLESEIYIYDISTMKLLHTIETGPNPNGKVWRGAHADSSRLCPLIRLRPVLPRIPLTFTIIHFHSLIFFLGPWATPGSHCRRRASIQHYYSLSTECDSGAQIAHCPSRLELNWDHARNGVRKGNSGSSLLGP